MLLLVELLLADAALVGCLLVVFLPLLRAKSPKDCTKPEGLIP
ncbi:hypothetical protein [Bradyrhizobium guangzhouense]|nr:hypothetical protein [Bradyrhizobium guangzhouense]